MMLSYLNLVATWSLVVLVAKGAATAATSPTIEAKDETLMLKGGEAS